MVSYNTVQFKRTITIYIYIILYIHDFIYTISYTYTMSYATLYIGRKDVVALLNGSSWFSSPQFLVRVTPLPKKHQTTFCLMGIIPKFSGKSKVSPTFSNSRSLFCHYKQSLNHSMLYIFARLHHRFLIGSDQNQSFAACPKFYGWGLKMIKSLRWSVGKGEFVAVQTRATSKRWISPDA